MSLFHAATKHVAKSSGSKTLHPVTDLNSAERFRTMCLVKKKTSFWFWKKPKMTPTQILFSNLFEDDLNLSKPKTTIILENFIETPTLKLDGSIGAKIASELNLSLSAHDSMSLTMKLGDIQKSEMDWEQLQETLEKQPINLKHQIFKEVKKSKRITLCVVLESVSTKAEGTLDGETTESLSTDDKGDIHKSFVTVEVNTKDSIEKKLAHSFTIPPSTVLAYSCNEFSINEDGYAFLHSAVDRIDSTPEGLFTGASLDMDPLQVVQTEFQSLIKSDKFENLRTEIKRMLKTANDNVLASMHLLLSAAEFKIENKNEEKNILASTVNKLFLNGENQPFKDILKHLGFLLPEDWNDPKAFVRFPEVDDKLIKPIISFLDSLQDVEMDVRTLLPNISHRNMRIISKIVENEVNSNENSLKNPVIQAIFKEPATRLLLKNAGFVEMKIDDEDVLVFTKSKHFDLMDLYTILYILSY